MGIQRKPDERIRRFFQFCFARENDRSDDETARRLGFEGPEALYRQMANDGYPVCPECGDFHPDEKHGREHAARKRKARQGGGETVEIPIANAVPLFEETVERTREDVEEIRRMRMRLDEAGRFVVEHKMYGAAGEAVRVYRRENVGLDRWRELCKIAGINPKEPEIDNVAVPTDVLRQDGAAPDPPQALVRLIAERVLAGEDMEPLLAAVLPNPDQVDRAALYKDDAKRPGPIRGLELYAKQVAKVICGSELRRGNPSPDVSKYEHRAADYVRERRKQGASDEEILAALREGAISPMPIPITPDEVARLGRLKLS